MGLNFGMVSLVSAVAWFCATPQLAAQQQDPARAVRRVAATATLAAQEYALGVKDGRIVLAPEVEEAKLFLAEARRSAESLPEAERAGAVATLDSLIALVDRTGDPKSLSARVRQLTGGLAQRLGVSLEQIPDTPPSLALGAEIYRSSCASCHGELGRGDGPAGAGLDPAPANLADAAALADATPLDFYRRITIGVAGTAMPAFEHQLSPDERWAVAAYATLLRLPDAHGEVPAELRNFAATAKMSDIALLDALGESGPPTPAALGRVAAVRSVQAGAANDVGPVFARVREQADSAYRLARAGEYSAASTQALDAYMTFEQVERTLRATEPALAAEAEAAFAALRRSVSGDAEAAGLESARADLALALEHAERALGDAPSPLGLFLQSLVILVREGLEAILIVGALLTFLVKTGNPGRRRDIHLGVAAALVASLLTALAIETVFHLSPARQEMLEGLTMLTATAVLFYVSYWLLSKMEVAKWTHFVKSRVGGAVASGSALALASAAFLAVYREGFETVLFYKALLVAGGSAAAVLPVVSGMAVGAVLLAGVYVAIHRYGVRLPLKPFFAVTSGFLYFMAFVFAGKGIAELQEGSIIGTTVLGWAPRIAPLGVYPTAESLVAQGVLVVLALVALGWTFVLEPRRLKVTSVMVPEPEPRAPAPAAAARAAGVLPADVARELVRSLERMEADLAELRAEVERMRQHVVGTRSWEVGTRS